MEVRADVTLPEMGDFRWLDVGPPGQEDVAITLMAIPGAAVMDDATSGAGPRAHGQGLRRHGVPHDRRLQADYEELSARGVEFVEEPEERPYGIDCGFRDPSGNNFRLTQVTIPVS